MDHPTERRKTPSLLCLHLEPDRLGKDRSWISAAEHVLAHARKNEWRIAHAACRLPGDSQSIRTAPGLEPANLEPMLSVDGLSAFHSTSVWQWAAPLGGPLYLLGGVFGLVGAATVVGAHVLDIRLTLIVDACGQANDGHSQASETRAHICALTRTISLAQLIASGARDNVVDLHPPKTRDAARRDGDA